MAPCGLLISCGLLLGEGDSGPALSKRTAESLTCLRDNDSTSNHPPRRNFKEGGPDHGTCQSANDVHVLELLELTGRSISFFVVFVP